jgi:integrase
MGLYKRKGKAGATWCIQYFAHGERIREAIGPSKREAELVLAKRKAALREGKFFDVRKESAIAFGVLCDRYLKEYAALHKKPRSYERNVTSTKVLKAFFGEHTLVKNIRAETVHAFILHRKDQGKAAATINVEVAHLSHLFTWACKLGLATHHPTRGIGALKANQKTRYLSREEIQLLIGVCDGDLRDMVILALGTGMRASEVLGLDRDHVDLKQGVAILPDTKNHDRRIVPLPPQVVDVLQQRPSPLRELFPGWYIQKLDSAFAESAHTVSLEDVTFHTLRHTFASHAVMAGVDLYTVAKLLGHRKIDMVQRYAHLAPAHLQGAAALAARSIFAVDVPPQVPHEQEHVA